jgi:cytochrome P450
MWHVFDPGWQGRLACAVLRRFKPILFVGTRIPGWVVLTRFPDVVEVLERDDVFSVCLYGQRMANTFGPFFLGMDRGPGYDSARAAARAAVRSTDVPRVQERVRDHVHTLVEAARGRGALDVIADLAEPVHLGFAADYLGIPGPDGRAADVLRWFRTTTFYIFNFWTGAAFDMAAVQAGGAVREYVDGIVRDRRAGRIAARDDVLGRLLGATADPAAAGSGLDDVTVGHTIAGIVSGALEPGIGVFARVLDRLLDLTPEQLAPARRAAHTGDDATLRRFIREAARFSPYPPYAWRYCTRDYMLAAGTPRQRVIPAGSLVVPLLLGAMFDGEVVKNPNAFEPGRPQEQYLNFGHGLHECLGQMLGSMMILEMVRAVLALPRLRRAPGTAGHPRAGSSGTIPEGYYALHFTIQFDA